MESAGGNELITSGSHNFLELLLEMLIYNEQQVVLWLPQVMISTTCAFHYKGIIWRGNTNLRFLNFKQYKSKVSVIWSRGGHSPQKICLIQKA